MKNTISSDYIHGLAVKATAGTLKRIYDGGKPSVKTDGSTNYNLGSANSTIEKLRQSLQADIANLANTEYRAENGIRNTYTISDAYDLVMVAYDYLYNRIVVNGMDEQDTETRTLKNGTEKTRTVYQWSCAEVRKAIYAEKSIESNGKYSYIEDMRKGDETSADAIDREYIRMGKYYDVGGMIENKNIRNGMNGLYTADSETHENTQNIIDTLCLTDRQKLILHYRQQGHSVTTIADKLSVSKAAISKTLKQIQSKVQSNFPEMVRGFTLDKWNK